METKEQLIDGLQNAVRLMKQAENLRQESELTNRKQSSHVKKISLIKKIWYLILGLVILECLLGGTLGFLFSIVQIAFVFCYFKYILPRMNKSVDKKNQKIDNDNQIIRDEVEVINSKLREIQLEYQKAVLGWYPPKYCSIDAAEFFLDCIVNYRADTLKEAINLYEQHQHQTRVEQNQQKMLRLQNLNNLLTLGSVIQQGKILSAVQENTAAVHSTTSAIHENTAAVRENTSAVKGLFNRLFQ